MPPSGQTGNPTPDRPGTSISPFQVLGHNGLTLWQCNTDEVLSGTPFLIFSLIVTYVVVICG